MNAGLSTAITFTNVNAPLFSWSILNTDTSEYNNYLSLRSKRKKGSERIDNMENDLKSLKDDINEIKTLLKALSNG